ncbi:hypothetical protein GCM10017786_13110 [Amycolatopsis deserti]|uniref:Uncharacterized protein n=1 Tax=Amycolatopsis deserti TaxID=185696 RepID=A0ABQ3IG52_9PSEU|nr:hypothetical protein [Amycolatopsis deserti]GHE83401.1 hypothetical protein GCM10017786_13110 [Amycolatopsis deserti]
MRQFTRWAQHLGGFLAHHGIENFLGNAEHARELDDDAAEWRAFLLAWHDLHGEQPLTAQQVRGSAETIVGPDPWAGTFPTTLGGKPLNTKSLAKRLTGQLDRWRGDVVLRSVLDKHTKMRMYWVERTG